MNITSKPTRLLQLSATVAALAAPAIVASPIASAHDNKVDGVRAEIKRATLEVKGDSQDNVVALRLKAGDANVVQVDVGNDGSADFSFARGDIEAINVKLGDGDDTFDVDEANGAVDTTIPTTIAGGDGDDSLNGGAGNETFKGGEGNDSVFGRKGTDTAYLGGGDDSFRWDPGDGSDVIEGEDGRDTMVFNGAGAPAVENVTLTANGHRLTFFRTPANITMDTNSVETVDFNALGGVDNVTVNDLTGTDVTQVNVDLAGTLNGNAGDGAVDTVTVNGTNGDDTIHAEGSGSTVAVTGLATAVSVKHPEPTDSLAVNTLAGTDNVLTSGIAGVLKVLVDGVAI